jgi:adenine-specific DNA glycosylase
LAASCHARAAGSQDRFPPAKARKAVQHISGFAVVAIRGGKDPGSKLFQGEALIYRARAPELLKGLWSFPIFTVPDLTSLTVAWQELLPKVNVFNFVLHPHAVVHSITHHRIQLKVVMVDVGVLAKGKREACLPEGFQWVPVTELERLWVSSLPRKIWKTVRQS